MEDIMIIDLMEEYEPIEIDNLDMIHSEAEVL
jgi:hypothetical protein